VLFELALPKRRNFRTASNYEANCGCGARRHGWKVGKHMAKEKILVHPNPNSDGYADNWVCEHIGCQVGKHDGDVWLCGAICEPKVAAGAEIVKVSGAAGK
jgi:hypothetical protein